jgi:hypothetical protein
MLSLLRILKGVGTFIAAATTAVTVKDCAPGVSLFKITDLHLEPSTPTAGQEVALTLSYEVPPGMTLRDGTSKYQVTFNFIPLTPTIHPLCQDVTCPITEGSHTNTTVSQWPQGINGNFKSVMEWRTLNEETLLCVEMDGMVFTEESAVASLRGAKRP